MRAQALQALRHTDPLEKTAAVRALSGLDAGAVLPEAGACRLALDTGAVLPEPEGLPGRPERPQLVSPKLLKPRPVHTLEGRASLLHALAHIEFNAINLALDIIWRFPGMPEAFCTDWLKVAQEEARHYLLLAEHLQSLGYAYGDFPAHDGLWEMALRTRGDLLARLALVPRTLEARGLDASPPIRAKLAQAGDMRAAAILDIILSDEIGHVAIGNHWYRYACEQSGKDPELVYQEMARVYRAPVPRGPFNMEARRQAGFTESELVALGGR